MTIRVSFKRHLLSLFLILPYLCIAQSKQFQHITSDDGISQSEVYTFLEDSQGFMWFGTVDGLNRYDGYEVTVFNIDKDSPNSISNNTIRCLAEDAFGRIWIGTDDGLSVYDARLEKIHQIKLAGLKEGRLTINTALIAEGKLYLGTSLGLFGLDVRPGDLDQIDKKARFVGQTDDKGSFPIVASHQGQSGGIWVATTKALYRMRPGQQGLSPTLTEVLDLTAMLPDIRNLEEDSFGNLWIVSHDNGFVRYSPETDKVQHFKSTPSNPNLPSNKISSVVLDQTGNLWIGTHDKGLLFLEKRFLNDEAPNFQLIEHDPYNDRSLNSNLIYSLFVSKDNLLWIGTIGSGINIYNPLRKSFQYYNLQNAANQSSHSTNFIRAVFADGDNNLWIGTHNNGLFFFDRDNSNSIDKIGFGTEAVFHLNDGGNGRILVCSGMGISLVKRVNGNLRLISTLQIGPVFYTTSVTDGIFWVATLNGLKQCRLDGKKIVTDQAYNTTTATALSFNNCRVLDFDEETNKLYVGTEGGGLNVLQLDHNMRAVGNLVYMKDTTANSISNNYVRSITRDANSDVWLGTYEGLNKLTVDPTSGSASFKSYTNKNGLPNNTIQSIVEDNQNKLWIGTNQGLCKFDPATESFTQYTLNDGIQSTEFSEHTIFKKPDNEIIIGGINGINTFYPEQIVASSVQPNITLTDFYLYNKRIGVGTVDEEAGNTPLKKSIALTDSILLSPDQNSFGFDFSAMVYNSPEKVQYAYMLEGFDEEWKQTDAKDRKANYTNLGYGDYIFRVKATTNDGAWEAPPKSVFVSIKTPIYYTTVAFILYGLLALLGIFFLANYSILRHTTKNKILLENQHNKKLRELEALRTQFFINVSHDLRTPLTLISSPLEIVLENKRIQPEVKSLLDLVARNVKKLRDMTEQLLDIRKVETDNLVPKLQELDLVNFLKNEVSFFENAFANKGIELFFKSDDAHFNTSFDPDMISKVLFNILSNALKHTTEGSVVVSLTKSPAPLPDHPNAAAPNGYVKIRMEDSGDGIDAADLPMIFDRFYQGKEQDKKGYGIGLSHSKDLVKAHHGHVEVTSEKGVGTAFDVYLPIIHTAEVTGQTAQLPVVKPEKAASVVAETEEAVSHEEDVVASKNRSVLLVEDNHDLRTFLASELKKRYTVLEAKDGEEGLEMATAHFPDLILSDVMMPKMDGMEFCKTIKSNLRTSHLPVILLTAKVGKESKYQGLEIGADEYISKPFEMKYLLLKIRNLLNNRERLRELFKTTSHLELSKVTVTSIDEQFLADLMAEIEEGIPQFDFSIKTLEQKMGMSHASFYNKIKSLTGQSAKELIFILRMKRAKQVLEDAANIRVAEVAYMVGFSDPKYFSKRFKEYFGCLPSEVGRG
ncbi:MAG: two-component regulator propeller domain-containing protein [Lewinella sp.]